METYEKNIFAFVIAVLFVAGVSSLLSLPIIFQWKSWNYGRKWWLPIKYDADLRQYISQQKPIIDVALIGQYTNKRDGITVVLLASGKIVINGSESTKLTFEDENKGFISDGPKALYLFTFQYRKNIRSLELLRFGDEYPIEYVKDSDIIRPGALVRFTKRVYAGGGFVGPKSDPVYVVEVYDDGRLKLTNEAPGTGLGSNGLRVNLQDWGLLCTNKCEIDASSVERENSFATDFIGAYTSTDTGGTLSLMQQNTYFKGDAAVDVHVDAIPVRWATLSSGSTSSSKEMQIAKTADWQFNLSFANGLHVLTVTDNLTGGHVATWVKM